MSGWSDKSGPAAGDDSSPRPRTSSFREGLVEHLRARAELAGLEAREAGQVIAQRGLLGIAAVLAAFFAYALLLVAAVSLLGGWLERAMPAPFAGIGWQVAALAIGALHAALAITLGLKLKRKLPAPLFEYTLAEFQKDRAWLQPNNSGNENDDSP